MDAVSENARSRIFDSLTAEARHDCLRRGTVRDVPRGHVVARQDDPADTFYLVGTGRLKLTQLTPDGREVIVRFVMPGEPFGGVVALEGASYPVTARATEPARLYAWSRDAFAALLQAHPQVRVNIMREMASHMADAMTRVGELTTQRVGQRLAHALLRLVEQCGRPTPDGVLIVHPVTRQELADLTGTTAYTVSRTLSQWESDGVLGSSGRRLVVRSPRRLEALASAD